MLKHPDPDSPSGFRYELTQEEFAAGLVPLITGPVAGTVTLRDGTTYDLSEDWVPVEPHHVEALKDEIHKAHREQGNYLDAPVPGSSGED